MNAPKVPSGPGPWMRFAREMIAWTNELKPITGQGSLVSQQSGGRAVNVRAQPVVPSNLGEPYPFEPTLSQDEDGNWFANVNEESSLLKSPQPSDNQTISGLGADLAILGTGDLVYLAVLWTTNITGGIASATIKTYGSGGSFDPTLPAWSSGNSYVYDDAGTPPVQQGLNIPIAQIIFDEEGTPTVIPLTITDLLLQLQLIDLIPAYIAVPFYGRYQ